MNISENGLDLIKKYETCRLEAYMPTPDDVPTIGWGHTRGVKMGDTCTQDEADAWLKEDVHVTENCINSCVSVPLTQNEFDALCSLAFCIGCTNFRSSTLLHKLVNSDYDGASAEFAKWNHQKGKVLAGLTKRRAEEAQLFEQA